MNAEKTINLVLLGSLGPGKSCLLQRFARNVFDPEWPLVVGVDFENLQVRIRGQHITVRCWDIDGQSRFLEITRAYCRGADGALLVFDVTHRGSFDAIKDVWLPTIQESARKKIPLVLVGNKLDKQVDREISEEAKEYARLNGLQYIETSAKNGENVKAAFMLLLEDICNERAAEKERAAAEQQRENDEKATKRCIIL
ncbi:Rab family GTPase [Aphelenchoides fujianensis]|nr:Rab family GTPase [Aphelenchoides fujianensis]